MTNNTKENALTPDEPPKLTRTRKAELLKSKAGFLVINFNYNNIVLPHDEGMALIATLKNAESTMYTDGYYVIKPISRTGVEIATISEQTYLDRKMSHLFGIEVNNTKE